MHLSYVVSTLLVSSSFAQDPSRQPGQQQQSRPAPNGSEPGSATFDRLPAGDQKMFYGVPDDPNQAIPPINTTSGGGGGAVKYAGVNIAGFDFGCDTDGLCKQSGVYPPLESGTGQGGGPGQMQHYVKDDKFNLFRLPVGWQYLVPKPGAPLNEENFAKFDQLVQACLKSSPTVSCILDIHNYARWNGGIIGQGGPSNEAFANLWAQLAEKYKGSENVWYGLMNEPHDLPSLPKWAETCQLAVNAIRQAGGKGKILLPGNVYTAAGSFVSSGSADALLNVKDPMGGTENLIFDLHNYFDSDNSGTHPECTSNKIANGFQLPVEWLRQHKREAIVSELGGGGGEQSCVKLICEALDFLNKNSDVYLGWVAWAAGGFADGYELEILREGRDLELMTRCFKGKFGGGGGATGVGGVEAGGVSFTNDTAVAAVGSGAGETGAGRGASGGGDGAVVKQPGGAGDHGERLPIQSFKAEEPSGQTTDKLPDRNAANGGGGGGSGAGTAGAGGAQPKKAGKKQCKQKPLGQRRKRSGRHGRSEVMLEARGHPKL